MLEVRRRGAAFGCWVFCGGRRRRRRLRKDESPWVPTEDFCFELVAGFLFLSFLFAMCGLRRGFVFVVVVTQVGYLGEVAESLFSPLSFESWGWCCRFGVGCVCVWLAADGRRKVGERRCVVASAA